MNGYVSPATPARPATYANGDRTRDAILVAATTAFSQDGFRSATMRQIADASDVSRAGLLYHFPSKEALLDAVLRERDRLDDERFFHGFRGAIEGLDYFRGMVRLVEQNARTKEIVDLYVTLSSEATDATHPAHEHFVLRYRTAREHTREALLDLHRSGELRDHLDVDGLAVAFLAYLDGLQVQWLLDPKRIDMPALVNQHVQSWLVPGVKLLE